MGRGQLRIYLGAAPGVGKTFAMLSEGRRRRDRGTDVVVGYVEGHGRPHTVAQIAGLEVVPRRRIIHRGAQLEEMDLDAVLSRRPSVALVDELAHTNAPGSRNQKRWEDIHELLAAGVDVITTVNVQHLESLNDVVETITGIRQQETVPDWVVRDAAQVELVDMTPEALRRRMAHGNVYGPDQVDAALANYFRAGNLAALRELALLWVADKVDDSLQAYREDHRIPGRWETRERVVVAVTASPGAAGLIRRAARIAQRTHGELVAVHVQVADGLVGPVAELMEANRALVHDLGGQFHEIVTSDIAGGLVAFARSMNATQLVLGASRRSRWNELIGGSVLNRVMRFSPDIDVHVISHDSGDHADGTAALPIVPRRRAASVSGRRRAAAWALAAATLPLLTVLLVSGGVQVGLSATLLLYLLVVVGVAAMGGLKPALASALAATLTANYYFTEPFRTLRMDKADQLIAIAVFVTVAVVVSLLVGEAARLSIAAGRARAEAEALAAAAGHTTATGDPLVALLARIRTIFDQDTVVVATRSDDGAWRTEAMAGPAMVSGVDGSVTIEVGDTMRLCLYPGRLSGDDRRVIDAFAAQLADTLQHRRLEGVARELQSQQQADQLRTAILRAVSHDLRSPLSSIKASATSLLQDDIAWTDHERHEFAETINQEADRLNQLIGNLLDMSRIEAGVVRSSSGPVHLDEVISSALASLSMALDRVRLSIDDDDTTAIADTALLERVVANLVANALIHTPGDSPVVVEAARVAGQAVVRVVDRGAGITEADRPRLFEPFQRLGDQKASGVGLGLAVVRGFVDAMGGELATEETPGGGLTVTVTLALAPTGESRSESDPDPSRDPVGDGGSGR